MMCWMSTVSGVASKRKQLTQITSDVIGMFGKRAAETEITFLTLKQSSYRRHLVCCSSGVGIETDGCPPP